MSKQLTPQRCCPNLAELLSPKLFKALGDPNRIAILARLTECCEPRTVSEIADCCPVNISVVSRHLTMLKEAGILDARKVGRQVFYSIRGQQVAALLRQIADCIEACCVTSDTVVKNEEVIP